MTESGGGSTLDPALDPALDHAMIVQLVEAARAVRANAYCPYSKFKVGAALLAVDGTIYSGANVENASYPVGVCAERSAISVAVSAGARNFIACAVITSAPVPVSPCGMCRQALAEFGNMTIIMAAPHGDWDIQEMSALLPAQFDPALLDS
ncbi:MAG: cytidine deaminase [Myxococcota bacterium]